MASQLGSKSQDTTTILLVEDNPADQRLIKEFFREIVVATVDDDLFDQMDCPEPYSTRN